MADKMAKVATKHGDIDNGINFSRLEIKSRETRCYPFTVQFLWFIWKDLFFSIIILKFSSRQ